MTARKTMTVTKPARTNAPPSVIALTPYTYAGNTSSNSIDITDFFLSTSNVLRVTNTDSNPGTLTIKAGNVKQCINAGIGDYVVTIPATSTRIVNQVESARFKQNEGGSLYIDLAGASMAGTIEVTGAKRGIA